MEKEQLKLKYAEIINGLIRWGKDNVPEFEENELSDGWHTFNDLYEFRKLYNAVLFNEWAKRGIYDVHKSIRHNDGELCFGGGWFIVVAILPTGQISNHYKQKEWDLFHIPEVDKALYPFDGHTPQDVMQRLNDLTKFEDKQPEQQVGKERTFAFVTWLLKGLNPLLYNTTADKWFDVANYFRNGFNKPYTTAEMYDYWEKNIASALADTGGEDKQSDQPAKVQKLPIDGEFHVWIIPDEKQILLEDKGGGIPVGATEHITFDNWDGALKLSQFIAKVCNYELKIDNEAGRYVERQEAE